MDKCNKPHQAVVRDCDSTYSNELFGPMWGNIHLHDVMAECRERLNEPLHGIRSDNFTSEHVVNFLFACTFTMILTSHLIEIKGDYDLEYSDIGYYQEELTCRSDIPGSMDLGNEISLWNCNLLTSAESKMYGLPHHEEDGKRKTSASETPKSAPSGMKSLENLVSTCKC